MRGFASRVAAARAVLLFSLQLVVAGGACGRPAGALEVSLDPSAPGAVRLTGLSAVEASAVDEAAWSDAAWQAFLAVRVASDGADETPPIVGRYAVDGEDVTFSPRFGFDPGRQYVVTVDPSRLPVPRDEPVLATAVALPVVERTPSTTVTRVLPSGEVWPENLLRLYVEFSAPMSRTSGIDYIRLIDDATGRDVVDPFLPLDVEFWNRDYTRYTLFFDPGRVKTDILPNREMGRALVAGRSYTLEVEAAWRDANGQPLVETFRRAVRVGPAALEPIDPVTWRIEAPAAGGRDPLIVSFDRPLDHGLLFRALGVTGTDGAPVGGDIEVGPAETGWRFTPADSWAPGEHALVVLSILEDPAGNRVGRPFEVDRFDRIDDPAGPDRTTLPFVVR